MLLLWIMIILMENIITLASFNDYYMLNCFFELPLNEFSIEVNSSEDLPIKKNSTDSCELGTKIRTDDIITEEDLSEPSPTISDWM